MTASISMPLDDGKCRKARAHRFICQDALRMRHVLEQAGRVEHLQARLEADEEAARRHHGLDRAHRDTLDRRRDLAELIGRIELDLDLVADPRLRGRPASSFAHSWLGSLTVGDEIFIVNCCALAAAVKAQDSSRAAQRRNAFFIVTSPFLLSRLLRALPAAQCLSIGLSARAQRHVGHTSPIPNPSSG